MDPFRKTRPLLNRPLEPLLPDRDVETRLPEGVAKRSKGVPVKRLGVHRGAMALEVSPGRRPAELLPQVPELVEELLARGKAPGPQARLAFSRIPAAEPLDHGLRMDVHAAIAFELAHRRRASEAFRALL